MPPGCSEKARTPDVAAEGVELDGEQHVRRLRLPVRLPLVVAALELHVVPAHARTAVTGRGDGDDAGASLCDRGPEPVDERVVAEVVGRELRFPARSDTCLGAGHDARVVDEDVDAAVRGQEAFGEGPYGVEIGEVERVDLDSLDAADRLPRGLRPPCGHHDTGARRRQRTRRLQAEARVAAGDDGELPGQIDAAQDFRGGAVGSEGGADAVLRSGHAGDATNWSALQGKWENPRAVPRPPA